VLQAGFSKRFTAGPTIEIQDLRLSLKEGVTVLFGASGSGKTTVLRCLAGLERPDSGTVRFANEVWSDAATGQFLPPRQRDVGFVPQDYALFPHLNVQHNIAYGLNGLAPAKRRTRIAEALQWLGLEGLEERLPRELSGGQQQRVALARALVRQPQLLLLDEPLAALDAPTRQRLRGELRALLRQSKIPAILVTHDRQEALALGDYLLIMHEGRLVQQGPVQEVFNRPMNLAVAGILAVETIQPGRILEVNEGLVTVEVGEVRLTALSQDLPSGTSEVFVCIRAEDVILTQIGEGPSSPRNRLSATVCALYREGPMVRVDLDCGFPLMGLLTKPACEEMALQTGTRVQALVKAPHIHLIPHG
jgi:molybdate transport system ATP-binding protein